MSAHREARWPLYVSAPFVLAGSVILTRPFVRLILGWHFDTFDYLTMAGILGCALWVFVKGERFR